MLQQPPVVTCRGTGPVQFPLSFLSQRDTDDMDPQTDARYKMRERRVLGNTRNAAPATRALPERRGGSRGARDWLKPGVFP